MRAIFLLLSGCFLTSTPIADGEACTSDAACASGRCDVGFCDGSYCGGSNTCLDNWQCVHYNGGFLSDPTDLCVPLCGYCPPNYSCDGGGSGVCDSVPEAPTVTVTASTASTMTGVEVSFTATATSPRGAIKSYTWFFGDGTPTAEGGTATATHAWTQADAFYPGVTVVDETGVMGGGTTEVMVCGAIGTSCEFHTDCCDGDCDVFGTNTCISQ